MKTKDHYNVLAVYSLLYAVCREHFAGILDEMADKNWRLSTVCPERFSSHELTNEIGEPYDGIILSMPGTDDVMERIARSNTPMVLINMEDRRLSAHLPNFASVWTDNADIGHCAATHLLERGEYKSACYIYGTSEFYSDERMRAFRETMKRGGYETSVFSPTANYHSCLRHWLKELPKPAAIMAVSDMRAADVINACKLEGIPVPSQVAIIGSDHDISQHAKCGMTISSVVTNDRMMGRQAVRELDFLFRHPKWRGRPHEVLIPAKEVFAGESTARSTSAAHLVKMAQDYINKNFKHNITPTDVVTHLGCSRSLAELRFSQEKGITVRCAIENARMEEVRQRIKRGDSVNSIVTSMQFTSANQLYRIYKRHFGHTLRQTDT